MKNHDLDWGLLRVFLNRSLNQVRCDGIEIPLVRASVYLVLLHFPILNRNGAIVTTAVTNMDIHDISRTARTFGVKKYFLVTPIEDQRALVDRILSHWKKDSSLKYHPDRFEAVSLIRLARDFNEVKAAVEAECGEKPEVVLTDAKAFPSSVSYADYRRELSDPARSRPVIVVLGTGWGVSDSFYPEVDRILAPIYGPEGSEGYNHLSVRAAAATILDRLLGL